jgi:hypothetical protein
MYYSFPQGIATNAAVSSATIRAFYGTTVTQNGTANTNTDCCTTIDTAVNCPGAIYQGAASAETMMTGRVIFTGDGFSSITKPASMNALTWNDDFILASTYQDGAP